MKTCYLCKEVKNKDQFYRDTGKTDGLHAACKTCDKNRKRKHYIDNKDHYKNKAKLYREKNKDKVVAAKKYYYNRNKYKIKLANITYHYGISSEEFEAMLIRQNGECAICNVEFSTLPPKKLHIDHSHKTGKIRGLLCSDCNTGIGLFKEYSLTIIKAANYLDMYASL